MAIVEEYADATATTNAESTALELIQQKIDATAASLKEQYKCEIHPMLFLVQGDDNDFVVGYLKEPGRQAKLSLLDRIYVGASMSAAADLLEICLIPEASDPRILSNDIYYTGACKKVNALVSVAVDYYKKK